MANRSSFPVFKEVKRAQKRNKLDVLHEPLRNDVIRLIARRTLADTHHMKTFLLPTSPSACVSLNSLFHRHVEPPRPHSVVPVEISHETPFAPHASTSEASSMVFIPPIDAQGYHGEGYNWDK